MSTNPRGSVAPGMDLSRWEIMLSEKKRSALQHAAPQYRRAALVDPV